MQKEASKERWGKHLDNVRIWVLYTLFGVFTIVIYHAVVPESWLWLAQENPLRKASDDIIPTFMGISIALTFPQLINEVRAI